MGLIDRLNLPDNTDSPLARALVMRGERSGDSGLQSGETPDPHASLETTPDTGAAVRALLKEIHLQHDFGIVTPSHLFSILHRHLQVTSGAFLVPEQGGTAFSPIAAAGLDNTSRFRLRIPVETIKRFCGRSGAVKISGSDLEQLRPFLSAGDFACHSRVAALPFEYNRSILAVLLVFDSPLLELDVEVLDVLLAAFSDRAGYLLFDGREKPFSASHGVAILDESFIPAVLSRLRENEATGKRQIIALRISLFPILEIVCSAHPHLDRQYVLNDLLETCALLCASHFSIIHFGGGDFLLLGYSEPHLDSDLLVHLLGTTIQQLFGIGAPSTLTYTLLDPDKLVRGS